MYQVNLNCIAVNLKIRWKLLAKNLFSSLVFTKKAL